METSGKLVSSACYDKQQVNKVSRPICNRSHAGRANSGEITIYWGCPSLMPSFEGNLLIERYTICSQETIETVRYHTVKPGVSISPGLESVPGRDRQTDRRTDRQNYDS